MRPHLLPAVRQIWRDASTLQLGSDPGRAVVLSGLTAGSARVLALLDGRRTVSEVTASSGLSPGPVLELVGLLRRCGALVDNDPAAGLPKALPAAARRRIRPDLAALSLSHGERAGRVLANRSRAIVEVWASGRSGPLVASLLAACGVGRVHVRSGGTASATDAVPGGLLPGDEHRPYATAAAEAVRRAAPEADTRPPGSLRPPGLIVLADQHAFQPPGSLPHYTRRAALLPLVLRDGSAVIGPLAVPGLTCCLNCVELHRVDRDPAWPAIAAQLRTGPAGHEEPSQAALIATAAGLAAMQALSFLDGGQPEAFGRSLELPGLGEPVRRRTWSPHPRCGCGGSQAGSRASPADHAPRKLPRSG